MQHATNTGSSADVAAASAHVPAGEGKPAADAASAMRDVVLRLRRHAAAQGEDRAAAALLAHLVRGGPVRASDLAEVVCLDRSTVSRHLRHLEEAGDVVRRPDPDDGRAALLDPTPAGRARAAATFARTVAVLENALASWPADDVVTLTRLLRRLADALETE